MYRGNKIRDFFGTIKVRNVTQADVEQFLDHLIEDDESQMRTVKDVKALFGDMMDQAVKDGIIAINPVKEATINRSLAMRTAKSKNIDDTFFSFLEAQLFLAIVETHVLYELFYTALLYGLRREEVLGLRWSCLDLNAKTFQISHTVTKGTSINRLNSVKTEASMRTYPLTDEQVAMFMHLMEREEYNRTGLCICHNSF